MKSLSDKELRAEISTAFAIRDLDPPSRDRMERLMAEVRNGRSLDSIHNGLDRFILNQAEHRVNNARHLRGQLT